MTAQDRSGSPPDAIAMRAILVVALLVVAACGGAAAPASPAPSVTSTPAASPSAAPTPTAVTRPTGTPIVLPSFAQVSAPSANAVWMLVAGTRLFLSGDRGATWAERSLPSSARNPIISFASDREGWLASVEPSTTPCPSQPGTLWRTTDGAATWQQLTATGIAAGCYGSLSFTDARHGFVGALDSRSGPVIYRTADAGASWTMSGPLADPPGLPMQGGRADLQLGRVRAYGATLLVTATIPAPAGPSTYLYRSQDGGASWTYAAAIPSAGALALVTATRWLRIGPPGTSFESTDAGATWHAYTTDYSQAAPIAPEIAFGDASAGYATVRGGLQRTTDGGAHWTTLKTPGTE